MPQLTKGGKFVFGWSITGKAKAIPATPTLTGKDAARFAGNPNKPTTSEKRNFENETLKFTKKLFRQSSETNGETIIGKFIQKTL